MDISIQKLKEYINSCKDIAKENSDKFAKEGDRELMKMWNGYHSGLREIEYFLHMQSKKQ